MTKQETGAKTTKEQAPDRPKDKAKPISTENKETRSDK